MDNELWVLVGLPLLIFAARMTDVTLGTVRIIFVSRGMQMLAPLVGFFEILVWLVAISQVLQHLDRPLNLIAYAAGFAAGTYAGIRLEGKLGLGLLSLRVITEEDASELTEALRTARFGVTSFAARGVRGRVRLLFTILQRQDLERALDIVRQYHPRAFVSVSDVRAASEGYILPRRPVVPLPTLIGQGVRKGK
jgi:uncharacterized protein YebE (UPF0316 family)